MEGEHENSMWADSQTLCHETFVKSSGSLECNRFVKAVKDSLVHGALLVVNTGHDHIERIHDDSDPQPGNDTSRQVRRGSIRHQFAVFNEMFGRRVYGQLDA